MTRLLHTTILTALVLLAACSETPPPLSDAAPPAPVSPTLPRVSAPPPGPQSGSAPAVAASATPAPASAPGGSRELEWDALIPDDYQPEKLLAGFNLDELSDEDPRAQEMMDKLKALWDQAPVREDLDGAAVRLPGFIVPVEADEKESTGFLLVPYYGACVHVPPPPANQTVYVITEVGKGARGELFDVVWVTGTMSVKRIDNDIAEAGYTLYATAVEPYE